ncbi:MAG: hypothetical protein EBZ48_16960, partial [Proteobacteria bacterium]|nr:hypothetical protein [Pseudomonadota bacterium]
GHPTVEKSQGILLIGEQLLCGRSGSIPLRIAGVECTLPTSELGAGAIFAQQKLVKQSPMENGIVPANRNKELAKLAAAERSPVDHISRAAIEICALPESQGGGIVIVDRASRNKVLYQFTDRLHGTVFTGEYRSEVSPDGSLGHTQEVQGDNL